MSNNSLTTSLSIRGPSPAPDGISVYEHQPLPSGDHIRRLILDPGEDDDPLVGRLEAIELACADKLYPFEAISYVWGPDKKDQSITVGKKALSITKNLAEALRQTRRTTESRAVWVDSVCINQEDGVEKGQQVALMGRIYETSSRTLICLGPGRHPGDQQAARDVAALVTDVEEMMDQVFEDPEFSWEYNSFPWARADDALVSDGRWESWIELVTQPWFRRGWVVQEAALGREGEGEGLVLWAGVEMTWLSVLRVHSWLARRVAHLKPGFTSRMIISHGHSYMYGSWRPKEAKAFYLAQQQKSLMPMLTLEVLDCARYMKVTDPRDRIYAFMNMPTSDEAMRALRLQPDYAESKSGLDVYREFAIKYLEATSDLDLLLYVEHDQDGDVEPSSFPSWIPRWDCGGFVQSSLFDLTCRKITPPNSVPSDVTFTLLDGGATLRVRATILDSVKYVSKPIGWQRVPEATVKEMISMWREVKPQSTRHPGPHQTRLALAFLYAFFCARSLGEFEEFVQSRGAFAQLLQSHQPHTSMDTITRDENAQRVSTFAATISEYRRFVVLGRGYYGIAPNVTREDDVCAVIFGTRCPFILRRRPGRTDHYMVIGAAYVQSKQCNKYSAPLRLGVNKDCEDWGDWDLPTEDIFLC